jgi:hypothetical protein
MITFDQIMPKVIDVLSASDEFIGKIDWLVVNRDLNGRVRLILPECLETDQEMRQSAAGLAERLNTHLVPHVHQAVDMFLYEASREQACRGAASYCLDGFNNVWVADRLATEANWTQIAPESQGVPRIVFFSIKGGVGRSTALAATAWHLAQRGKRVLVLDLDLESPGLSAALLPADRQPKYGITDWLVEDLVDNADAVFPDMVSSSNLSHDGEIFIVPAHGSEPGEYISKLGRVWMPKLMAGGTRESWSVRLGRLLVALEERFNPDAVLIDSRSGIDEIASACITDIGANLILLFAVDGNQTWNGYHMLFEHWQRAQVTEKVRERLQVVGALVPELDRASYLDDLREDAYQIFGETLYDELPPPKSDAVGQLAGDGESWRVDELVEGWNFDEADEGAPHYPWAVNWHRGFAALKSLHGRLTTIDAHEVDQVFASLLTGVGDLVGVEKR